MNKVFFGTLISHAKNELNPINSLLVRASNHFLTERSIDEAILHLKRSQELLLTAKHNYITHLQDHHNPHHHHPQVHPHTQETLS